MTIEEIISNAEKDFAFILNHLKEEYAHLQVGRANSSLVENISVEVYGVAQPIKAIASLSVPDPRTIQIQPWDRGSLVAIEKAIVGTGMGLNPVNDGVVVRISIPPLTEEKRKDLTKIVHKLAEDARIAVRTKRQDANSEFKKMKAADEITEDDQTGSEKRIQEKVEKTNETIAQMADSKEKDIMTV